MSRAFSMMQGAMHHGIRPRPHRRPRRSARTVLAALVLSTLVPLVASTNVPPAAAAPAGTITVFDPGIFTPTGIAPGPDGNVWFTSRGNDAVGKITPTGVVSTFTGDGISSPTGIAAGPDGNLWFTNEQNDSIGRITPAGVVSNFTDPALSIDSPHGIVAGPDGNLWFTNFFNNSIGRITPAGVITSFTAAGLGLPQDITRGPDGNLWFTNRGNNSIGRITTVGAVTLFTDATIKDPFGIAAGSDGNLWFTNLSNNSIGRVTTAGVISNFTGAGIAQPLDITGGADGNLYFVNGANKLVGQITTAGVVSTFADPVVTGGGEGIAAGPDGNVWFTFSSDQIGRITPTGAISAFTGSSIMNQEAITVGPDGDAWVVNRGTESITRVTPTGAVTVFKGGGVTAPYGITTGPDGNIWFTDSGEGVAIKPSVGRITPAGVVTMFTIPGIDGPEGITAGPDGNIWFSNFGFSQIGRVTPAGAITLFGGFGSGINGPDDITSGPDGNIWFTNSFGNNDIGRITPAGVISIFPESSGDGADRVTAGPDGNVWFVTTGGDVGKVLPDGTNSIVASNVDAEDVETGADGNLWITGSDITRITPAGVVTPFPIEPHRYVTGYTMAASPAGTVWFTDTDRMSVGFVDTGAAPAAPPSAPSNVVATPLLDQAAVTWSPPADEGSSPVTSYTVTSSPAGGSCTWTSGPLTCTVGGLTNGETYTFTVTATNDAGTGPPSAASASITLPSPLTLDIVPTTTPIPMGTPATERITVTNTTGNTIASGHITVITNAPATITSATPNDPAWSCTIAGDQQSMSCDRSTALVSGEVSQGVDLTVLTPPGPQLPCVPGDLPPSPCVVLRAWNGSLESESTADPEPIGERIPVSGDIAVVTGVDSAPYARGGTGTATIDFGTVAGGPGTTPVSVRIRSHQSDMTFVSAAGAGWTCAPDAADATAGVCTINPYPASPNPVPSITTTFNVGAGTNVGCGSVPAPCALLDVIWEPNNPNDPNQLLFTDVNEVLTAPNDNPDLSVRLSHTEPVHAGAHTDLVAQVANVGTGPTTGTVGVTVELPPGFTPESAQGSGWTCSVDAGARTATCTRQDVITPNAIVPPLTVSASLDPTASSGVAVAIVDTAGDPAPAAGPIPPGPSANNRIEDPLDVIPVTSGPDGFPALGLEVSGPERIARGQTVSVVGHVQNTGDLATDGPTTVRLVLPDGLPSGQRLTATPSGDRWTCASFRLRGSVMSQCTHPDGVGPHGGQLPDLRYDITAVDVPDFGTVDLPFTLTPTGTNTRRVHRFDLEPPRPASLDVAVKPVGAVPAGERATVNVIVTDSGRGSTTGPLDVDVPNLPGLTITKAAGDKWTCAIDGTGAHCRNGVPLKSGMAAEGLSIEYGAPADAVPTTHKLIVAARSTDLFGPVSASGLATVAVTNPHLVGLSLDRSSESITTDTAGRSSYDLTVANISNAAAVGTMTLTELLPPGVVASGSGPGWSCSVNAGALACTLPSVAFAGRLAPGASLPPVRVAVDFPDSTRGTTQVIQGAVRAERGGGGVSSGTFVVPAAPPPAPKPQLTLKTKPVILPRGANAVATLAVRNAGDAPLPAGSLIGVVAESGVAGLRLAGGVPGLTCQGRASGRAALVCRLGSDLAPGGSLSPEPVIDVAVQPGAPDKINLAAGIVVGTGPDPTGSALETLVGSGASALRSKVSINPAVTGIGADAGPPQTVFDIVQQNNGADVPTVVTLDGSRSRSPDAQPLTFEWVQTAGPPVAWQSVAGTVSVAPAGSPPKPFASGDHPKFTAPRVRGDVPIELGFQLTVHHPLGTSKVATTTVTVQPAPNRAPVLGAGTASAGSGSVPAVGTRIVLKAPVTDPDGDTVTRSWRVVGGDGPADLAIANRAGGTGSLVWPPGTNFVVVEVTASDGRGGVDTAPLTLGLAPPPLTINATGPSGAIAAGTPVTITATASGAPADQITWVWQQIDGPTADPALINPATGSSITFPAPAASAPGQSVRIRVIGTRGTGAAASADDAIVTVQLADTPPPVVAITGATSAGVNQSVTLNAVATGAGPFTFAWRQSSGPGGTFGDPTRASTTFSAPRDGVALVTVTATDAAGRSASASLPLVVGTPFAPSASAPSCADAATLAGRAFQAATQGQPLSASVGPVSFELGQLTVTNPCPGADAELAISNASLSIANGVVTGSGLSGTVRTDRICLTGGELSFPAEWGVGRALLAVGSPLCLETDPNAAAPVTGSFTMAGLPFLRLPPGTSAPITTVDFNGSVLRVVADATLPTGGSLHVDLTAQESGAFTANAVADDIDVLGQTIDLTGSITGNGSSIAAIDVHGSIPGPITLVPGTTASNLEVRWGLTGTTISADANVGNGLALFDLDGSFIDSSNYTFSVRAKSGSPPVTLLPGLTVDGAQFVGVVGAAAGVVTFDVQLTIGGSWSPIPAGPVTLDSLGARLANTTPPAGCPNVPAGSVWFAVTGSATIQIGTQPVRVNAVACAGAGGAWSISSTATFGSWKPVATIDATVESLGFEIVAPNGGTDVQITLSGRSRVLGVDLGANVHIRTSDFAIAVDMFGDLGAAGVGLPSGSVGHVVLASADFNPFHFDDPVLANETVVHQGLTVMAGFAIDPSIGAFMSTKLGVPPVSALVVKVELGAANITLTASIALGPDGITLFELCNPDCTPDNTTSLKLQSFFLSISITGRIGFGATSRLHLPRSSADAPASDLNLTAEIALDLSGPAITLALYTSDGTWHSALGITGLDFADLAIQGGVNFASPVPVPTVGFGATVVRLPDPMAELIGADPNHQEAMSFVLNISQTAPILAIQVGVQDGNIALRPLRAFGQQAGDALQIDYAKVVFAPLGGTVGPYTFAPGMGFGFAAIIMDVPVEVAASVSVSPPLINALVSVGTIDLGSIVLDDVHGQFRIDTNGLLVDLGASLTLPTPGGTPLDVAAGLTINAGTAGFNAHFEGTITNWQFAPGATISSATIEGDLPEFALVVDGSATILGNNVHVAGGVTFAGIELEQADIQVDAGPFRIGTPALGVTVTGAGCDGVKNDPAPTDDGACVRMGYDRALDQPFSGFASGEVNANGATVAFTGSFDAKGINATGTLTFGGTNLAVTGRFYAGTTTALSGTTETLPNGTSVQVKTGDWKVSMAAEGSAKLAGFNASLKFLAGSLNNNRFFASKGSLTVFGNTVNVTNTLSFGSSLQFHTEIDVNLSLDGHTLASGRLVLDNDDGVSFAGDVSLARFGPGDGPLTVRLSGSFSAPVRTLTGAVLTPARFNLTAIVDDAQLVGAATTLHVTFTDSSFRIAFDVDSGALDLSFDGTVDSSLKLCVNASAEVKLNNFANPTGTFSFCNKGTQSERGLRVTLSVKGYTFADRVVTAPRLQFSKNFSFSGTEKTGMLSIAPGWQDDFKLGAEIEFDVDVDIDSDNGVSFNGSGSGTAFYKHWHDLDDDLFEEDWEFGRHNIGSVSVTVDEEDRSACAEPSFFGVERTVCI